MEDYYNEKINKKHKTKIIKSILVKLIYILALPIIIWNLSMIIQTIQNPYETPSMFGIKIFCIISGSIEPNISVNDLVIIKEVPQDEIQVNDIISYDINGEIITHRVVDIYENANGEIQYITQGDANNIEDSTPIIYENIKGKYIGKIPQVGRIVLALKSKTTLGIVLTVLITLYIFEQRTNRKKIRRNNERIEYEKQKNKTV